MKTVDAALVAQATLFDTYAPIESYFAELGLRLGPAAQPAVRLQAIDAHLLRLFAELHQPLSGVVDLAGEATCGATTLLWAAHPTELPVVTPVIENSSGESSWVAVLQEQLGSALSPSVRFIRGKSSELLHHRAGDLRPVLVAVAMTDSPEQLLAPIFAAHPAAIVFGLPFGLIGDDPRLEQLLAWARQRELRFAALRELNPFLAASQLAAIFPARETQAADTLKRIARLFTSNFDFLTLAHQAYTHSRAKGKLEKQLQEMTAKFAELEQVVHRREAELLEARGWAAKMDESAQGWATECERNVAYAQHVEQELRTVTSGRAWSMVQRLVRLRHRLIPRNSLRARCGRLVLQVQRRLRAWVLAAR